MVLKITRDELPMEQGVYGGYLLCPLYPLLISDYTRKRFFFVGYITNHLKNGPSGRGNKINCFPRDQSLTVHYNLSLSEDRS